MIRSFGSTETEKVFQGMTSSRFPPDIQSVARRKLVQIDAAVEIRDLVVPPGNRLERLQGNRTGQWSIRVNDQWRICFRWEAGNAYDVEIVDYH